MLKGRGSIEFEHGAKRAVEAVSDRPELVMKIQLALADRLREEKRTDDAVAVLRNLLRRSVTRSAAAAASATMTRLDAILRQKEDLATLAATYRDVFEALVRPRPSRHGRATPYYQIGARYAQTLDDLHQPQQAEAVRVMIGNVISE